MIGRPISGDEIGPAIIKALGLKPNVVSIEIRIAHAELVTATVTYELYDSDARAFAQVTSQYRLVEIRPADARRSPGRHLRLPGYVRVAGQSR